MAKPLTILVVDDDVDDKEMFMEVVSEINSSVQFLVSSNGQEALQLLKNTDLLPDLIFLDLNMPRLNGKQCLQQLKKNERFSDIPVIIYTTSKSMEDKEETERLGAYAFITKPSGMKQLKQELEKIFVSVSSAQN